MVYLTGDTHGDIERFKHGKLRWLGKRDIVVVLGDFGFCLLYTSPSPRDA